MKAREKAAEKARRKMEEAQRNQRAVAIVEGRILREDKDKVAQAQKEIAEMVEKRRIAAEAKEEEMRQHWEAVYQAQVVQQAPMFVVYPVQQVQALFQQGEAERIQAEAERLQRMVIERVMEAKRLNEEAVNLNKQALGLNQAALALQQQQPQYYQAAPVFTLPRGVSSHRYSMFVQPSRQHSASQAQGYPQQHRP